MSALSVEELKVAAMLAAVSLMQDHFVMGAFAY